MLNDEIGSSSSRAAAPSAGGLVDILHRLGPWAAPTIYLAGCVLLIAAMGAPFTFPLDDSYIHLALARTLATSGVWGVLPSEPAAASSSPLWSALLAAGYVIAPHWLRDRFELVPLALNMAASLALLGVWRAMLADIRSRDGWVCILTLAVPLSAVTLLGMEHVLHLLLASVLAFRTSRAIAADSRPRFRDLAAVGAWAALAVACRYETAFLVGPLTLAALWFRRPAIGAVLIAGATAPIVGFGLFWLHSGAFFLPNALLIKGAAPAGVSGLASIWQHLSTNIGDNIAVRASASALAGLSLVSATLILMLRRAMPAPDARFILLLCSVAATLAQFTFAAVGWLYRYEAWLIGLDLVAMIPFLSLLERRSERFCRVLVAVLAVAVAPRAIDDAVTTAAAAADRRSEHIAVADFLREHDAGQRVVVNDLGAAAYFSGAQTLDMFGLGSNEPVRLRRRPGGYDAAAVRDWAERQGASIAVVQLCWKEVLFRLPDSWRLVAVWHIPRNVVFGDHLIGFFAIAKEAAAPLRSALESFPLPRGVSASYPVQRPSLETMVRACAAG